MEFPQAITRMRGERTQEQFARDTGLAVDSIRSYECGRRRPGYDAITALLRDGDPPQQRVLLESLGIKDVIQFAEALLASAGVATATVTATVGGNGSGDETEEETEGKE